jgi:hypothetical protein
MQPRTTSGAEKGGTRSQPAGQAADCGFCHAGCHEGPCLWIRATFLGFCGAGQSCVSLPAGSVLIWSLPSIGSPKYCLTFPSCIDPLRHPLELPVTISLSWPNSAIPVKTFWNVIRIVPSSPCPHFRPSPLTRFCLANRSNVHFRSQSSSVTVALFRTLLLLSMMEFMGQTDHCDSVRFSPFGADARTISRSHCNANN